MGTQMRRQPGAAVTLCVENASRSACTIGPGAIGRDNRLRRCWGTASSQWPCRDIADATNAIGDDQRYGAFRVVSHGRS